MLRHARSPQCFSVSGNILDAAHTPEVRWRSQPKGLLMSSNLNVRHATGRERILPDGHRRVARRCEAPTTLSNHLVCLQPGVRQHLVPLERIRDASVCPEVAVEVNVELVQWCPAGPKQ